MKNIAFIGTREIASIPKPVLALYQKAAWSAARSGYRVVTGAAQGADQIAAAGALAAGGCIALKLPWESYERGWWAPKRAEHPGKVDIEVYKREFHDDWTRSVIQFHPNPEALTQGAFALHARNYGIINGATTVVAIPNPSKAGGGGTGQGLRIAQALRIRCFDLTDPEQFAELYRRCSSASS